MKFKIRKEVDMIGTWYWTVPSNMFLRIICFMKSVFQHSEQSAYDVWSSLKDAEQHIERWNSGYYKEKYYSKYIESKQ